MTVSDVDSKYNVRPFVEAPPIEEGKPEVIKLDAIDLSQFQYGPEGLQVRERLANQLEKTITASGFFNVINFGYDTQKLEYLKAIAQSLVELPESEKEKYYSGAATAEKDSENKKKGLGAERGEGFKPKGFWKMSEDGVRDSIVHFNFRDAKLPSTFKSKANSYPELFAEHWKEVNEYYTFLHTVVLKKILYLCDIILQIPEGSLYERYFTLAEDESIKDSSGGHGRFMMYHPLTKEDASRTKGSWLRGHSDISAFSLITSQPILALQIKDFETGQWKYVDYRPNSLVCNIGDALEFLTGGYFKASIHRVTLPPEVQLGYKRLVLIDFINPREDTIIHPKSLDSAKLKSLGLHERPEWDEITYKQWDDVKGKLLGEDRVGQRNLLFYYGRHIERWHHKAVKDNIDLSSG
ncbi:hypothetical protein CLIB1423_09S00914 [[Candida] railenensis]|uniref:Fe2OG dioxygenase domain-containing protein n=1 Tax=[Candida] railenensis TaxID=45579 RepID=A0A9P0VYK3_9ASCO|nr:hypothetical protein CLIB1423_09S00914 [[Candida] railenensis]